MDVAKLDAIDVHTHVAADHRLRHNAAKLLGLTE
jgi:hypothetical protein